MAAAAMTDFPRTLKHITLWLLLGTGVFLGVQAWQAQQQQSRFSSQGGVIELRRAADGHFHWPGRINGVAVDFLVDTGATRTALPEALARAAGLVAEGRVQSSTAGGTVTGWVARADLQLQGGVRAERLPVTVLPALAAPLLGMDVLGRLHFSQADGVLRLQPAPP
jgi:aspartyl protease family protein